MRFPLAPAPTRYALLALLFATSVAVAQPFDVTYDAAFHARAGAEGQLPFWLSSNQYGLFDRNDPNVLARVGVVATPQSAGPLRYALGLDAVARYSEDPTAFAHQLYIQARYGIFELVAGRKEAVFGMVDSTLSMGSTTWSRNATPIPRVTIEVPEFVPVPGTRNLFHFKGLMTHGWFEDDRFTSSPYLHQKQFYLRLFWEDFPVRGHGGIMHSVVWAGTHPTLGKLPSSASDFVDAFFSRGGSNDGLEPDSIDTAVGNAVGAYDFALDIDLVPVNIRIYRQFFIDSKAGVRFRNPWDGLWGVHFRLNESQLVRSFLWEHMYFVRMGAKYGDPPPAGEKGRFPYYHNRLYRDGWTYEGRILGLPLVLNQLDAPDLIDPRRPDNFIVNNIISAHHFGIEGRIQQVDYRLLATFSRNYGIKWQRLDRTDQTSVLLEASGALPWPGFGYHAGVAADWGDLFESNWGATLGVTWSGR